jgi:integrase
VARQGLHVLRSLCTTLLQTQRFPARVVQDVIGHSHVSLTLDTYSHVMPAMLREAAEAMDRALSASSQ